MSELYDMINSILDSQYSLLDTIERRENKKLTNEYKQKTCMNPITTYEIERLAATYH